jgi:hypothetical protein
MFAQPAKTAKRAGPARPAQPTQPVPTDAIVVHPVPTQSFVAENHILGERIELTSVYATIDTPAGFHDIQLYEHQKVVVKAILDAEDRRVLTVRTREYSDLTTSAVKVETSALVLSEPFGSGKTIEILALILWRPIPRAFPVHINNVDPVTHRPEYHTEITQRFTGQDALITPNLIVVGSSVLVQWENAIRDLTSLKVLKIGDVFGLKAFRERYESKRLNTYDIVLLKNGNVTGSFVLPGEDPTKVRDYRSLVTVMGKLTSGSCWSRVIYDDFDTINIPVDTREINALVTLFVSGTQKIQVLPRENKTVYSDIREMLRAAASPPLESIFRDQILFTNFNIRNEHSFTETSTQITKINAYRYVYANPDDNYIRLLGAMGEEDATGIMEMLNGDAIETAAVALGIKTTSVADIFQKMLDKKYERYLHDQRVLETITRARGVVKTLEPHPEGKRHKNTALEEYRATIVKENVPKFKYYSVALDRLLDDMTVEFQAMKESDGLAISRVIDNIKEGMCQICALPLEEFDTFIVRCCGLIVCDMCGIKGNQIRMQYDYKTKSNTLCGSCANCKAPIYPRQDLIFVDRNFDIEALLTAKGDEVAPVATPSPVATAPADSNAPVEPEIKNPKLKCLLQIIRGLTPESQEEFDLHIPRLLIGRLECPCDTAPRRTVVFANYNETLNLVEKFLTEQGIRYLRLGGTAEMKATTVKQFKESYEVLLVNSQVDCAGLNLQFGTDLVYFHKITNKDIESQVAGRFQRIGRPRQNARFHYLCYNNERALM